MIHYEIAIDSERLREICIDKHWYTCGTNYDYEKLLNKVGHESQLTPELLTALVLDIYDHSDFDDLEQKFNCTTEEIQASIAHDILERAYKRVKVI